MPRGISQTPQALQDLVEIAAYLAKDRPSAALRFLDAAEETYQQLAKYPNRGSISEFNSSLLRGIRRWRIKGFTNYLIFYLSTADGIEVIRVLHGARDIEAIFTHDSDDDDA